MTAEQLINERINNLQEIMDSASSEVEKLHIKLDEVNKILDVINNLNESILNNNISEIEKLFEEYNIDCENGIKSYKEVQDMMAYYVYANETNYDIYDEYKEGLIELSNSLLSLRQTISRELDENNQMTDYRVDIKNLKDVISILNHEGDKKYITEEMLLSLNNYVFKYYSVDELTPLYEKLYESDFFKLNNREISIEDVTHLFHEYLGNNSCDKYITDNQEDISSNINFDNAKSVLKFFKDNDLLRYFENEKVALVDIVISSDLQKVSTVYEKIKEISSRGVKINNFFTSNSAEIWKKVERRSRGNYSRENRRTGERDTRNSSSTPYLYTIFDYEKNVELLKDYSDVVGVFSENDLYAHPVVKTTSPNTLKRNLEICRVYRINKTGDISLFILKCDLERRANLAIELGLLSTPVNKEYDMYSYGIPNREEFENSGRNIRDYFANFNSKLFTMNESEFAYLAKKLSDLGPAAFYSSFFSGHNGRKGMKSPFTSDEKVQINNIFNGENSAFIDKNQSINNYSEYSSIIDENQDENFDGKYFDLDVLNDELIRDLEQRASTYDSVTREGQTVNIKNHYVYKFDKEGISKNRLISRYKVLRNASILKKNYGYLDKDMLLTAIVKGSYITALDFEAINNYTHVYGGR